MVLLDRVGLIRRSRHQAIVRTQNLRTQKAKNPTLRLGFSEFGRCQRMTRHCVARPAGRCCATFSRCARVDPPPPEVLILFTSDAKNPAEAGFSNLVGDRGFEPPTPSSRTKCATRLRQSPNAGRILLRRCAPVNPLVSKCHLIGEKVVSPLTARRFSVRQGYDTSCCSH